MQCRSQELVELYLHSLSVYFHSSYVSVVLCLILYLEHFVFFSLPLRLCYHGFERELLGEDFESLKYFTIFNTDLYLRIHTYIYMYKSLIIMYLLTFLQDYCFWDVTPCSLV